MIGHFRLRVVFALVLAFVATLSPPVLAQGAGGSGGGGQGAGGQRPGAQSYTTITSVTVNALSNGIQIRIIADGLLQYRNEDLTGRRMGVTFPDARNGTGKNFWNINRYPLSHLQMTTPQGATRGIGQVLAINLLSDTSAVLASTPDGQGVLITIRSDRTIETRRPTPGGPRPGGATPAPGGAGNAATPAAGNETPVEDEGPKTDVVFVGDKLTVKAVRADIHGLIAQIARKTGLSVAVDDAVNRSVSLYLDNLDPAAAIQSIATANGLALQKLGGVTMMSEGVPTDLATYRLSGTQSFRMQNTQAVVASGLLPNFLNQYVNVNAEQNAVVITAPQQMLDKIGKDLKRLDTPSPQIVIEAIAVEFTDTDDADLGLAFKQLLSTSVSGFDSNTGAVNYTTIGKLPQSFEANLRALEFSGKARVRARPKMAVVNGRTADIFIGAQRFIQTQFNAFGQTQTRIQPVDVGVKLLITPLTGGNGEITTRIAPEVSNITELDIQTGLPVLSTRRADTVVRIKDGETVAIGGLTLNQEQITRRKIPVLGDIPILGNLFRSQKRSRIQTELVVFVTPRILTPETIAATPADIPGEKKPIAPTKP